MENNSDDQQLQQAAELISKGQIKEGESIGLQILEQQPENAQAHYVIGLAAYMRNRYRPAIKSFTKASELAPGNPMIFSNLGESLRRIGEHEKALKAFEESLKLAPGFNMGLMGLANTFSDLKQNDKAMKAYQRLLGVSPDFAPGYHHLGSHLAKLEQHKQALPMLRKAVALRENYTEAQVSLANSLERLDQVDEAVEILEHLLDRQPKNIGLLLNLGNIKKTMGKLEEADEYFERVLELDPDNIGVQYSISHAKKGQDSADINAMEARFEDPKLNKNGRRSLHFTVGKYYDDVGDYAKAFEHFKQGNDLDDRIEPYKPEVFSDGVDRIIATFTKEFFKKRAGMGCESETPVFIVGMPRSGTSLTEQTLASHSQVYGAGELKNIGDIMRMVQVRAQDKRGFPEAANNIDPITACNLGEQYVKEIWELSNRGDYLRITDKMPGNTTNLGLIALLLPRAKIIHCKRSPMDSCFSCYTKNFSSVISYSRQLEDLGQHYRDYHRLMEHWKRVLPIEILEVRYEETVADHEAMARKLLDYVGLEWDPACLDFEKTERRVKTASTIQVRQPIYNSSVAKWRQYEDQLKPLYNALGELAPRLENDKEIYF